MAEMSRNFNSDDFDALCAEALEEHHKTDAQLAAEDIANEEEAAWAEHDRVFYPGEIGGVACQPSLLPDPPEAA